MTWRIFICFTLAKEENNNGSSSLIHVYELRFGLMLQNHLPCSPPPHRHSSVDVVVVFGTRKTHKFHAYYTCHVWKRYIYIYIFIIYFWLYFQRKLFSFHRQHNFACTVHSRRIIFWVIFLVGPVHFFL